jgi:hypothetical protein
MKIDFEQFKCVHHSCDPPPRPEWLPYDSSIVWGFIISAGLLAGGGAVLWSAAKASQSLEESQ